MESWVKFRSLLNISGTSQQNSRAALSVTTEAAGDLCEILKKANLKKKQNKKKHKNESVQLVRCDPSLQKPRDAKLIWSNLIYTLDTWPRSCTCFRWGWADPLSLKRDINNNNFIILPFQISLGAWSFRRLWWSWMSRVKPFFDFNFF